MPFDSANFHDLPVGGERVVERDRGAPEVRIFRRSRSVIQAGGANSRCWIIEFEPVSKPFIEPLMGWTGSEDPTAHLRLTFGTREQAVSFARRQGWNYSVYEPPADRPATHPGVSLQPSSSTSIWP